MSAGIFSSHQAQRAVWALLPDKRPGMTATALHALLPQYTLAYVRSALSDMIRNGSLTRDRAVEDGRASYVLYRRGAYGLREAPLPRAKPGFSVRKCLPCREPFQPGWRTNFICPRCADRIRESGSAFA